MGGFSRGYGTGSTRDATYYNLQDDKTHHGFGFRGSFFMRAYLNESKALTESFCQCCIDKFDFHT